jgi:hypothetical protein
MIDVIGRAARSAGEERGWPSDRVALAAREYLRFIRLIERYPTEALVPSADVDAVWHHHLNTEHYHRDFVGRAPHHDSCPVEARAERFSRTRSLYRIHFGEPGALWAHAAPCPEDPAAPEPRR